MMTTVLAKDGLTAQAAHAVASLNSTCIEAKDRPKHVSSIERIAQEMHRSVEEIAPLYIEVLEHMQAQARIRDYLPVLVSKNVKNILSRSASQTQQFSQ